ncbi:Mg(2+)-transport-ATPase-associated protein MgtC [hydrothermal vent metagenome]|uniref:Mg(2+)-transport-ATPase-associated protein MgtC n=1 Tax=hydrothermal vent metagenome TaxID=652676 RepID=A0A3B1D9Q0_9ZZZZ
MSSFFWLEFDFLIRLLIASLFGGLVGLERDIHGRDAGLRTHLLVSLGAGVFMVLSEVVATTSAKSGSFSDPTRIAAQIVTGIGFLGAGVIIKAGVNVRGLTTAASLWTSAGIGMAAGGGYYVISAFTTALALGGLILLKRFERTYAKDYYRNLTVTTSVDVAPSEIATLIQRRHLTVLNRDIEKNYENDTVISRFSLRLHDKGLPDDLFEGIIQSLEASPLKLKKVKWSYL